MIYTLSTLHRHKFNSSRGYTFVLTKISERSQVWYFVPANYLDAMWMVWLILLYVVYNCFEAYVSIAKLLLSWCYDQLLPWKYLKGFPDPVRFHFRVVFLSSPCSVELNIVLGRLRHPLTTYVTMPGLALVTVPLFSLYQSFEQLLQSLVLLPSCVPACMLMIVID